MAAVDIEMMNSAMASGIRSPSPREASEEATTHAALHQGTPTDAGAPTTSKSHGRKGGRQGGTRPHTKKGQWSEAEEMTLALHHREVGNKWAAISKSLPTRSDNDVKNHWNSTLRSKSAAKHQTFLWLYAKEVESVADNEALRQQFFELAHARFVQLHGREPSPPGVAAAGLAMASCPSASGRARASRPRSTAAKGGCKRKNRSRKSDSSSEYDTLSEEHTDTQQNVANSQDSDTDSDGGHVGAAGAAAAAAAAGAAEMGQWAQQLQQARTSRPQRSARLQQRAAAVAAARMLEGIDADDEEGEEGEEVEGAEAEVQAAQLHMQQQQLAMAQQQAMQAGYGGVMGMQPQYTPFGDQFVQGDMASLQMQLQQQQARQQAVQERQAMLMHLMQQRQVQQQQQAMHYGAQAMQQQQQVLMMQQQVHMARANMLAAGPLDEGLQLGGLLAGELDDGGDELQQIAARNPSINDDLRALADTPPLGMSPSPALNAQMVQLQPGSWAMGGSNQMCPGQVITTSLPAPVPRASLGAPAQSVSLNTTFMPTAATTTPDLMRLCDHGARLSNGTQQPLPMNQATWQQQEMQQMQQQQAAAMQGDAHSTLASLYVASSEAQAAVAAANAAVGAALNAQQMHIGLMDHGAAGTLSCGGSSGLMDMSMAQQAGLQGPAPMCWDNSGMAAMQLAQQQQVAAAEGWGNMRPAQQQHHQHHGRVERRESSTCLAPARGMPGQPMRQPLHPMTDMEPDGCDGEMSGSPRKRMSSVDSCKLSTRPSKRLSSLSNAEAGSGGSLAGPAAAATAAASAAAAAPTATAPRVIIHKVPATSKWNTQVAAANGWYADDVREPKASKPAGRSHKKGAGKAAGASTATKSGGSTGAAPAALVKQEPVERARSSSTSRHTSPEPTMAVTCHALDAYGAPATTVLSGSGAENARALPRAVAVRSRSPPTSAACLPPAAPTPAAATPAVIPNPCAPTPALLVSRPPSTTPLQPLSGTALGAASHWQSVDALDKFGDVLGMGLIAGSTGNLLMSSGLGGSTQDLLELASGSSFSDEMEALMPLA